MPVWDPEDALSHPVDFRLVTNAFVSMFHSEAVLESTLGWLSGHDYDIRTVETSAWADEGDLHRGLATILEFPDYYGHNLDALNDCMSDVADAAYGVRAGATGLVLVLRNFDAFTSVDRRTAQLLLDIFAVQARNAALVGNRMICLVHSDDPCLGFEPVGAMPVLWNDADGQTDAARARRAQRELRVLLNDWDPIGVFDPDDADGESGPVDEYDCIRDPLISLLLREDDPTEVAAFLRRELADHFGLDPGLVTTDVLDRIFTWWRSVA